MKTAARLLAAIALAASLAACVAKPAPLEGGRRIESTGGDIYAKTWGNSAGPDILMIHGSTSHLQEFEVALSPALADSYHLTAYDRPGMGRSTKRPSNASDLSIQAETAAEVIRATGLKKPVIVAHSYGGAVALRLALDHPDLISGLVLLAPASHPWEGGTPFFFSLQATPVIGEIVSTLSWPLNDSFARNSLASRVFAPQPIPEGYFEASDVSLAMRPSQVRASSKDFTGLLPGLREQAPRYAEITMPVSVLAGRHDQIAPIAQNADPDKPAFSNQHLIIVENAGHMPHHARPDLVEQEIRWVLEETAPPR